MVPGLPTRYTDPGGDTAATRGGPRRAAQSTRQAVPAHRRTVLSAGHSPARLYQKRSILMWTLYRSLASRWLAAGVLLACALLGALAPVGGRAAGPPPPPAPPATCPQFGVNLSGGEFGSALPGTYGVDYLY